VTRSSTDDAPPPPPDRLQLSVAQVAGSSAAAVSAAVLCSFFGVAGTIIGTAAASILATTGSALYSYSLRRTQARLRRLRATGGTSAQVTAVFAVPATPRQLLRRVPWRIVALGTANVFVFAIGLLTGIEGILGQTISSELGVSHHGSGTTLNSGLGIHRDDRGSHKAPKHRPTPSATTSGSPSATPTSTGSPTGPATSASPPGTSGPSPSSPVLPTGGSSTPSGPLRTLLSPPPSSSG
jgi:hypothetical protein